MKPFGKIKSILSRTVKWFGSGGSPADPPKFAMVFDTFQKTLGLNNRVLECIADMGDKLSGDYVFDIHYIQNACHDISGLVHNLVYNLNVIAPGKYQELFQAFQRVNWEIDRTLDGRPRIPDSELTLPYSRIDRDAEDVAGAKNANIAEIRNVLELPTPEGFAVSTGAFNVFMDHNGLWDKIDEVSRECHTRDLSRNETAEQIRMMVLNGTIPSPLQKSMMLAVQQLAGKSDIETLRLAVRSSAWKEDGRDSFAGQYTTLLNQRVKALEESYKTVLASAFSSSAVEYRRQKGLAPNDIAVAVGCQRMIDAKISGVLYTADPLNPSSDNMLATAVWGLGVPVVDGTMAADHYRISRRHPHTEIDKEIAEKKERLALDPKGGTVYRPVKPGLQNAACLDSDKIGRLSEAGLIIERHFKSHQDIEFAFDHSDRLVVLQARPLYLNTEKPSAPRNLPGLLEKYPVCLEGIGDTVQRGVGIGNVFIISRDEDLDNFPVGGILVARYTSPRFAKVVRKAVGIITDIGSATGHMATIAREFRVPTLVNAENATQLLTSGQEITLDAGQKTVYFGRITELEDYSLSEPPIEETFEYRLLRRVLKMIGVLNLLDPTSRNFSPSGCRTFHDITRFVHEKAVEELINQDYRHSSDDQTVSGKLKLGLPLDLVLIDIDGGLRKASGSRVIEPHQIASRPMKAFVDGLTKPGAWNTEPMSVDFSSFMSSMTRTFSPSLAAPRHIGQNLAVLSESYAHVNLRLGYHFNIIDVYMDEDIDSNYAYFRFMGGVTDPTRRTRRAALIADILVRHDFRVELRGDLVVARIKKLSADRMEKKVYLLGVLVAFSRQLDVQMASDSHVRLYVDKFNQLVHSDNNTMTQGGTRYEHQETN